MAERKESIWTWQFIAVIMINVCNGLSSFMINPIMSTYLVDRGLAFELTGLISSLMSYVALVFRPFSGAASDRFNKKKMMLYSFSVIGICMFLYHFSHNVTLAIIIRIIHGVAFAISSTVSMAFATSFVPDGRIAESLGYITLGSLIGQMFGPTIGSWVSDNISMGAAFIIAGCLNFIAITIIFILPYKHEAVKSEKRKIQLASFFAVELIVYVILVSLLSGANGISTYYLKPFGTAANIENITVFYTVSSLISLLIKPFFGRLQDKKGISYVLIPGYIFTAVELFLISKATSVGLIIVAGVLKAFGQGVTVPAIQAECVKILGKERSGVAVSTCYIGQDIGNSVGPTIASYIIKATDYRNMYSVFALIELSGIIIFALYALALKRKQQA